MKKILYSTNFPVFNKNQSELKRLIDEKRNEFDLFIKKNPHLESGVSLKKWFSIYSGAVTYTSRSCKEEDGISSYLLAIDNDDNLKIQRTQYMDKECYVFYKEILDVKSIEIDKKKNAVFRKLKFFFMDYNEVNQGKQEEKYDEIAQRMLTIEGNTTGDYYMDLKFLIRGYYIFSYQFKEVNSNMYCLTLVYI